MRLFVNDEFLTYLATFFGAEAGTEYYVPEFDVDGDGVIDIHDIAWFSGRYLSWVEIGGPNILLSAGIALGGILIGYAVARVL